MEGTPGVGADERLARIEHLLEQALEILGVRAGSYDPSSAPGRNLAEEHDQLAELVRGIELQVLDLSTDVQGLNARVRAINARLRRHTAFIDQLQSSFEPLAHIVMPLAWAQSLDPASNLVPVTQVLPVRAYIGEPQTMDALRLLPGVTRLVEAALTILDLEFAAEVPAEEGSVLKKWWGRTKTPTTQDAIRERLEKVERAVELQALGGPQADIDYKEAQAAATLIDALPKDVPSAVQVGSLLLINLPGDRFLSRTLTTRELIELERNQDVLRDPATVLQRLAELSRRSELPSPEGLES